MIQLKDDGNILTFFQHKCYLHAKVPRVMQSDGKIKTQEVPWARKGSGFTLLFEAFSMLLIENEMPVNKLLNSYKFILLEFGMSLIIGFLLLIKKMLLIL